jgi:hypothetical protein
MHDQHERKWTRPVGIPHARVQGQLVGVEAPVFFSGPTLPAFVILEEVGGVHGARFDRHRGAVFRTPDIRPRSVKQPLDSVRPVFRRIRRGQLRGHGICLPRNDLVHGALMRQKPDDVDVASHGERAEHGRDDFLTARRLGEMAHEKRRQGRAEKSFDKSGHDRHCGAELRRRPHQHHDRTGADDHSGGHARQPARDSQQESHDHGNERNQDGGNHDRKREIEGVAESCPEVQARNNDACGGRGQRPPHSAAPGFRAWADRLPVPGAPGADDAPPEFHAGGERRAGYIGCGRRCIRHVEPSRRTCGRTRRPAAWTQ